MKPKYDNIVFCNYRPSEHNFLVEYAKNEFQILVNESRLLDVDRAIRNSERSADIVFREQFTSLDAYWNGSYVVDQLQNALKLDIQLLKTTIEDSFWND